MKTTISIILILISFNFSFGQNNCNSFIEQYKLYNKVIQNELLLPKYDNPISINTDDSKKYLKTNYGKNNVYLDSLNTAWGGNWFACRNGGIARRWEVQGINYPDSTDLSNHSSQKFWKDVKKMNTEEVSKLSPIEKFDIYMGNTFFQATNYELKFRGPYRFSKLDDNYCGFCNGARAAGALVKEPITPIVKNSLIDSNIKVTFNPTDLKALVAASYFYLEDDKVINLGLNFDEKFSADNQCNPNAGVFDIILREYLGANNIPLFLDVMGNEEKWNETILGYDRKVNLIEPNTDNSINAKYKCLIELTIYSQDEVGIKDINEPTKSKMANRAIAIENNWIRVNKYSYELFLDKKKNIIDGVWISEPIDYAWIATGNGADNTHIYSDESDITKGYNGNSFLDFNKIIELVNESAK